MAVNLPKVEIYLRNRTIWFLTKKSAKILHHHGPKYWLRLYLSRKIPKIIHHINNVPLVDIKFNGHSLGMPIKRFKDSVKVVGLSTSMLVVLGHRTCLDKLAYLAWLKNNEELTSPAQARRKLTTLKWQPKICVVIYGQASPKDRITTIDSVERQSYPSHELVFATHQPIGQLLTACQTELVMFVKAGDELAPQALLEIATSYNSRPRPKLIYSDEDKIESRRLRAKPFFKPGYSPELLLSFNYMGHSVAFDTKALLAINPQGLVTEQWLYQALLQVTKTANKQQIVHIPKVLYHGRSKWPKATAKQKIASAKPAAQKLATPKVTIIIPFRDKVDLLRSCLNSIQQKTTYSNYEILLVNNQSQQNETHYYLGQLSSRPNIRQLQYNQPFNYSAINNFAVTQANSEVILLLNNDTQVITPGWLTEMVNQLQVKGVGAVGAKLLYDDDSVQHAGVVIGLGGAAGHVFRNLGRHDGGYFDLASSVRNTAAVTGACLLTKKSLYNSVGGLDEVKFPINYNDIDYCLKLLKRGQRIVYTPHAELYHYESASRGRLHEQTINLSLPEMQSYKRELGHFQHKWRGYIQHDPYYSPHLTRVREDYSIAL